jgi:hypothetical protein
LELFGEQYLVVVGALEPWGYINHLGMQDAWGCTRPAVKLHIVLLNSSSYLPLSLYQAEERKYRLF